MLKETATTTCDDIITGSSVSVSLTSPSIITLDCGFCAQCSDCVQKHLLFYAYVERMEQSLSEQQVVTLVLPHEVAIYILQLLHIDIDWCNESAALTKMTQADTEINRIAESKKVMDKQQDALASFRARWNDYCCIDPSAIDNLSYFDQDHCALLESEVTHLDTLSCTAQRKRYVAEEKRMQFFFISHRDKFAFRRLTGHIVGQASPLFTYLLYHSIQWRMEDTAEMNKWRERGVGAPQPLSKITQLISRLSPKEVNYMQLYLQCKVATPANMVSLQSIVGICGDGTRPTYTCNDEYEWWCTGGVIPTTQLEIVHRVPYGSDSRHNSSYIVRDREWHGDQDLSEGQVFKTRKMLMQWLVDQGYTVEGTYCPLCLAWRRNADNDNAIMRRFTYHCNKTCPNYK